MKIRVNSWHTIIYTLAFGGYNAYVEEYLPYGGKKYGHNLPKTLCGYFWSTLTAAIILLILSPIWILPAIGFGIEYLIKKDKKNFIDARKEGIFSFVIGVCFAITFVAFIVFSMIAMWFNKNEVIVTGGIIGYFISALAILLVAGTLVTDKIKDIRREKKGRRYEKLMQAGFPQKPVKVKRPNVVWEFIKAKKNKYCPRITWE